MGLGGSLLIVPPKLFLAGDGHQLYAKFFAYITSFTAYHWPTPHGLYIIGIIF